MASLRIMLMTLLSLISVLSLPVNSQSHCQSMSFPNNSFADCVDLPTLNGLFHWTYDAPNSALSMGFTAPSDSNGWIAWAINPTGTGMVGSQAIMCLETEAGAPAQVKTMNITSYQTMLEDHIAYNVTRTGCVFSSGNKTLFGSWVLPDGEPVINVVWQVGPVKDGMYDAHDTTPDNLDSKMTIDLSNGVIQSAQAQPPWTLDLAKEKGSAVKPVVSLIFVFLAAFLNWFY